MDKESDLNKIKELYPKGGESQVSGGQPSHIVHIGKSNVHLLIMHLLRLERTWRKKCEWLYQEYGVERNVFSWGHRAESLLSPPVTRYVGLET